MPSRHPPRRRPKKTFAQKHNIQWDWHWRSVAACIYLLICLCDFVVMPVYCEFVYNKRDDTQIVKLAETMPDSTSKVETLKVLKSERRWTPLTNDTFHLAFGAILGVSALPMNRRRRYEQDDEDDYDYHGNGGGYDHGGYGRDDYRDYRYGVKKPGADPDPSNGGGDSEGDPSADNEGGDTGGDGLPPPTGGMG
jgi:hypothetical protein